MERGGKPSVSAGVDRLMSPSVAPARVRASFLPDKKNDKEKRHVRRVTSRKTFQRGEGVESELGQMDFSTARSGKTATRSSAPIAALLAIAKTAAMTEEVPLKGIILANRRSVFHKTRLCPRLRGDRVFCPLGESCTFAHSEKELRPPPVLDRTKLCPSVLSKGASPCPGIARGEPCKFAHSKSEIRHTSNMFKTNMCLKWNRGKCKAGAECNHAHGEEELRFYRLLAYSNGTRDFRSEAEVGALRLGRAGDEKEGAPQSSPSHTKDMHPSGALKGGKHIAESAGNQKGRQNGASNPRSATNALGLWGTNKSCDAVRDRLSGSALSSTSGCMSASLSGTSSSVLKLDGDWRREDEGTGCSVSGESSTSFVDEAEQQRRQIYEELLAREQEQRRREQATQEEYQRLLLTLAASAPDLFRALFLSPNTPVAESETLRNLAQLCPQNGQNKRQLPGTDAPGFEDTSRVDEKAETVKKDDRMTSWRDGLVTFLKPAAPVVNAPDPTIDDSVLRAALAAAVQSKKQQPKLEVCQERPARSDLDGLLVPSSFSLPKGGDDALGPRLDVPLQFPLGSRVSTPCRGTGSGTPDSFSTCAGGEDCMERLTNCLQFAAVEGEQAGSVPPSPLLFGSQSSVTSCESVENASFMSTPPLRAGLSPFSGAANWEQKRRSAQDEVASGSGVLFPFSPGRSDGGIVKEESQKDAFASPLETLFADPAALAFYSDPWGTNEEREARDASSPFQVFTPVKEVRDATWSQAEQALVSRRGMGLPVQQKEKAEHGQAPGPGAAFQDALALLHSLGLLSDSAKPRDAAGGAGAETPARG
ncbi:zinc finger (CCCH type) motif-containing protein [Toxoplasma gondii MAS]|uniref:Zinc finger (CCCH type) motif-containing protein n=2 Tax=Toxoplasma gondii TaxID=5811 RepID=A0A086QTR8_TOXGO|nr:zinc finger (CCCH type) motif-containing protein [Toxoplasma gondii MAS]PUA90702.1 zinc finger (CCCH type) motif-containing protein [Toxoplasma gondii TgCATBr9]